MTGSNQRNLFLWGLRQIGSVQETQMLYLPAQTRWGVTSPVLVAAVANTNDAVGQTEVVKVGAGVVVKYLGSKAVFSQLCRKICVQTQCFGLLC